MKKRLLAVALLLSAAVGIGGCSLEYELESEENFDYGVSKKQAFVSRYYWDGTEETQRIIVPGEYGGVPVTKLGGYCGRGVPCPFFIDLSFEVYDSYGVDYVLSISENDENWDETAAAMFPDGYEITEKNFVLVLGANVVELYYGGWSDCYVFENGDGSVTLLRLVYSFECDENNQTFYAADGVLYSKATGEEAVWSF